MDNGAADQVAGQAPGLAYIVSRFPVTTETFIVRELDEIASRPGVDARLYSLFPAPSGARHEVALRWLPRARRSTPLRALRGLAWCFARHPLRTLHALGPVVADYFRRLPLLLRALIAFAAAAAHVHEIADTADHVHAHFATYPALGAWLCHRVDRSPLLVHRPRARPLRASARAAAADRRGGIRRRDLQLQPADRRLDSGPGARPSTSIRCGVDLDHYEFVPDRCRRRAGRCGHSAWRPWKRRRGTGTCSRRSPAGPGMERIQLDLVGSGKLRAELTGEAERLGISAPVRFLGSLAEDEVADLLREAHLFVLPSVVDSAGDMEGIPVALMEAMAAGVPVVSSRLSGIPELVRDGRTGLLADPGDVDGLRAALRQTIEDPLGTLGRVRAAHALVTSSYGLQANAARLGRLLGTSRGWTGTPRTDVRIEHDAADHADHASGIGARLSRRR